MRREHARSTRTATPLRLFHATILRKSPFCERHGARARCAPPHAWAPPLPVRVPKGRSVEPQRAPLRVLDVAPTWHPRGTHVDRGGSHLLAAACRFAPAPSSLDLRSISARSPLGLATLSPPPSSTCLPVTRSPRASQYPRGVPLPTSSAAHVACLSPRAHAAPLSDMTAPRPARKIPTPVRTMLNFFSVLVVAPLSSKIAMSAGKM